MNDFIVALDVDDVCLDLINTLLVLYNRDFQDTLKRDDITDWTLANFVKDEAKNIIYKYFDKPYVFSIAPPVEGSLEGIGKLRNMGFRIIFITANNPEGIKEKWLFDHGFMEDHKDFYQAYDKSLIHANILLDDKYQNARDFRYGEGWLLTRPWNKKYEYSPRISNWDDFISKIEKRFKKGLWA
jgi:5'(3')-deoxyribonucleotidase